mmetsp:Transcript_43572/g.64669  ORF Transcript_43572/g.64669 Transcript_43572/m.64669 type:complete len:401 (-) Transcript_43572:152-1354(-)
MNSNFPDPNQLQQGVNNNNALGNLMRGEGDVAGSPAPFAANGHALPSASLSNPELFAMLNNASTGFLPNPNASAMVQNSGVGGNNFVEEQLKMQLLTLRAQQQMQQPAAMLNPIAQLSLLNSFQSNPAGLLGGRPDLMGGGNPGGGFVGNAGANADPTIVDAAYQRGREEALMSLRQSGMLDHLGGAAALAGLGSVASGEDQRKQTPLEVLGQATTTDRRKNNQAYFDASSLADPDPVVLSQRRARGGVTEPFPEKLHRMIKEVDEAGQSHIVGFFDHGRAFSIFDPEAFCKEVMPKYFKQSRLSSFQRQLNLYGFTRINSGPDSGGYYHELFLRGRPALAIHMRRVGVPEASSRSRYTKGISAKPTVPDFYNMPSINSTDAKDGENVDREAAAESARRS